MDLFDEILATSRKLEQQTQQQQQRAQQQKLLQEQQREQALETALQSHATRALNAQKQTSALDRVTQRGQSHPGQKQQQQQQQKEKLSFEELMQKARQNTLPSNAAAATVGTSHSNSIGNPSQQQRPKVPHRNNTVKPTEFIYSRSTTSSPTAGQKKQQVSLSATNRAMSTVSKSKSSGSKSKLPSVVAMNMVPLGTVKRDKRTVEEIQRDIQLKKNPELAQEISSSAPSSTDSQQSRSISKSTTTISAATFKKAGSSSGNPVNSKAGKKRSRSSSLDQPSVTKKTRSPSQSQATKPTPIRASNTATRTLPPRPSPAASSIKQPKRPPPRMDKPDKKVAMNEDDPEYIQNNISSIISSIFGTDKAHSNQYVYSDDDDLSDMEVSARQQELEDRRTARLGRLEDEKEEMRQRAEAEEEKMRKKKKKMTRKVV